MQQYSYLFIILIADSHVYNERIYASGINGIFIITNFCVDDLTRLAEVGFFMMYQQDWIMRQIQSMVQMIARIIYIQLADSNVFIM